MLLSPEESSGGALGDRVAGADDGGDHEPGQPEPDDRRQRALDRERLDRQVVGLVDAEQHDHEQEQHDDRAGVDDHLHGGEEVGLEGDEVDGDAEQREHERERGVHRVASARSTPIAPASTIAEARTKTTICITGRPAPAAASGARTP